MVRKELIPQLARGDWILGPWTWQNAISPRCEASPIRRAGAAGYLLKGSDGADIATAVRAAGASQAVFGAAWA